MVAADFDISGENYCLRDDIIDTMNGDARTCSNSGDLIVGHSHNDLRIFQERKDARRVMFKLLCRMSKLTLYHALKNHSCDPVESEPLKIFTKIFRWSQKKFHSQAQEDLLPKTVNDPMVRLERNGPSDEDIGNMDNCTISDAARHDLA
jgi:hypothetical protein